MKFCTSCGAALEFFEFLDGDLCSSCLGKDNAKKTPSTPSGKKKPFETEELAGVCLYVEKNNIILKSAEGWVLWSGPMSESHQIQSVLNRAVQILKIRKKRAK